MPNTFVKIATVTVGSGGTSSIDFTSIPQTYTDLCIKGSTRTDRGTFGVDELLVQFNGDTTGTNYAHKFIRGNSSSIDSNMVTNYFIWGPGGTGSVNTANTFGNGEMYIPNYSGNKFKSVSTEVVSEGNATSNIYMMLDSGIWNSTSAITSIKILSQGTGFDQYSTVTLYGISNS